MLTGVVAEHNCSSAYDALEPAACAVAGASSPACVATMVLACPVVAPHLVGGRASPADICAAMQLCPVQATTTNPVVLTPLSQADQQQSWRRASAAIATLPVQAVHAGAVANRLTGSLARWYDKCSLCNGVLPKFIELVMHYGCGIAFDGVALATCTMRTPLFPPVCAFLRTCGCQF